MLTFGSVLFCGDINECAVNNGGCPDVCANTPGNFYCECPDGYELSYDTATCEGEFCCADVTFNESRIFKQWEAVNCDMFCIADYALRRLVSVLLHADINECTRKIDSCDELCINTPGSYRCDCPAGFELQYDQQSCADIDECARGTSSCSQACINTHGSFRCECSFGYMLSSDSQTCVGKVL